MGLKVSCSLFQAAMNKLFPMSTKDFIAVYPDDLTTFSQSFDEHFHYLSLALESFAKANMSVNVSKSRFFLYDISFLSHIVSGVRLKSNLR